MKRHKSHYVGAQLHVHVNTKI